MFLYNINNIVPPTHYSSSNKKKSYKLVVTELSEWSKWYLVAGLDHQNTHQPLASNTQFNCSITQSQQMDVSRFPPYRYAISMHVHCDMLQAPTASCLLTFPCHLAVSPKQKNVRSWHFDKFWITLFYISTSCGEIQAQLCNIAFANAKG